MLGVTINVLCSHHPMVTVTPRNNDTVCEVFVGLLMQYHYVGLDTVPVCGSNNVAQNMAGVVTDNSQNVQPSSDSDVAIQTEALDDATVQEGDDHRWQISGAPQASMMCVKEHGLPAFLHRRQCHYCTVDAGAGHGSIHVIDILYLSISS